MKITLDEVPGEGHLHVEVTESAEDLNRFIGEDFSGILEFRAPVSGVFDISKREGTLFVDIGIDGSARVVCSRCLAEFDSPFHGSSRLVLYPEEEEGETGDSHDNRDYYDGEKVDLGELLEEEVSLLLPFSPLCSNDCKGLCSLCGANLNKGACSCPRDDIDERFSALKGLKI